MCVMCKSGVRAESFRYTYVLITLSDMAYVHVVSRAYAHARQWLRGGSATHQRAVLKGPRPGW